MINEGSAGREAEKPTNRSSAMILDHSGSPPVGVIMKTTIAASGHRPGRIGGYTREVEERLYRAAIHAVDVLQPDIAISGMALGWDQAWALACLDAGVPVIAAVPCTGQDSKWPVDSQALYQRTLRRCENVVFVTYGPYTPACMHKRDRWMVDHANELVVLWDGNPGGGTTATVEYAKSLAVPITNMWDFFNHPIVTY